MSIQKLATLLGLCVLFAGCSTGSYTGSGALGSQHSASKMDMGVSYLLGRGVQQNDAKAFYYFNQAANSDNDPFAQNELAYLYASGKGTTQDYSKAAAYYEKAAEQGLASAQYNLGLFYLRGLGVPANRELAKVWLSKAAAKGFIPAKNTLATLR